MYVHKLCALAVENLLARPLRTAFLVLTVAIGAGATMFLHAFHKGLDVAIRENLLKGMPDKLLEVKAAGQAESFMRSQMTGLFTLGKSESVVRGITPEQVERMRGLADRGVTKEPVVVRTRPQLPFQVRLQPDFDRLSGVLSLAQIFLSQRDMERISIPFMFHGIDGERAARELPVTIELAADEVAIYASRQWLEGAENFGQLKERQIGRAENDLKKLAALADMLFFKEGAQGLPVFLVMSKNGARHVVNGRVVGVASEASLHGLSVDSALIEQWNRWNNEKKAEPYALSYNAVEIETRSTEDLLAAAADLATDPALEVSGRLVTARRLTNLRNLLPPAALVIGVILAFLAAGGIIVGLSLSVAEQTKRIAILRSVGARLADILFIFLCEAFLVGAIGVIVAGQLLWPVIGFVDPAIRGTIPGIDDIESLFNPSAAFNQLAAAVGILVALLAGLVPAFTATLIKPSEVLKV